MIKKKKPEVLSMEARLACLAREQSDFLLLGSQAAQVKQESSEDWGRQQSDRPWTCRRQAYF